MKRITMLGFVIWKLQDIYLDRTVRIAAKSLPVDLPISLGLMWTDTAQ